MNKAEIIKENEALKEQLEHASEAVTRLNAIIIESRLKIEDLTSKYQNLRRQARLYINAIKVRPADLSDAALACMGEMKTMLRKSDDEL